MRGHISERRPGTWRIVISAGTDPAGRRRQIVRTVHGSKRDAERALVRLLRDLDEGRLADGRQLLSHYLEHEWLPGTARVSRRGRPLAPTTLQRYRDAVRHVNAHIGAVRLCDLRPAHVERLRDALLERLAPQTVGDVLRVLSQALAAAEARGYVGRNVADPRLVPRPAGEPRDFPVIDPALGRRILEAATGTVPWDAAAHLALGLGLRREEVLGLRWSDVDEDTVRVRRTLTAAGGRLHFGPPKSRAGERDLPMPSFVAAALRRHRKAQAEHFLGLGLPMPELVVCNPAGQPYQPATFSGMWRDFAKANGFDGVTFHALRHGAATLLLAAGVPDAVAAAVMGHADTKILRRYQDVVAELKRDAAAGMDRLLGGTV
jgi:integrase